CGEIISLFLLASFLFSTASCLMCSCCPTSRNSIVTRLLCSVFLLFSILIAIIMFAPLVEDLVNKVVTVHLNLCKYINCNKNSAYKLFHRFIRSLQSKL
uniref:Uncharacterized protein n=1 Tax=Athene cunicularia TaxID=194338 RepID=A0A663MWL4_ATHCN